MNIRSISRLAVAGFMLCSCQSRLYQIEGYARDFAEGDTICLATSTDASNPFAFVCVNEGKFHFAAETDSITMCLAYVKKQPACHAEFFTEPGTTTAVELNSLPKTSRVSGTVINNAWQQLADSINAYGKEMAQLLRTPIKDTLSAKARAAAVDSLHRQMSDCILRTATHNKDNPLGKYIQTNYQAPEF